MRSLVAGVLAVAVAGGSTALALVAGRKEQVHFRAGETGAAVKGSIKGHEIVDYVLGARKGQTMVVALEASNGSAYFNVTAPGADEALFIGSTSGNRYEGTLPASGEYTVRLYLMRSAARRGETATYTIRFHVSGAPARSSAAGFDQELELQGITFHVACPNDSSAPTVTITPSGLAIDDAAMKQEAEGHVVGAEVADLNVDGSPEIYVYVQSAGSGSYASLVAYSANARKSLSRIYLPPITDDPRASKGYLGHDEFRVVERTLVRRFPVYRDGDTNAKPTGGTRQIQYELAAGEAGWVLRADRVVEY
jgi:hypothetical protein